MLIHGLHAFGRKKTGRLGLACLLFAFMLLSGCSSGTGTKSTISIPSPTFTTLSMEKPIVLDNGKTRVTISEITNTGEKFGMNGRLAANQADKNYCLRLKMLVENVSNSPVDFGETSIIAKVNDNELPHSGIGTATDDSGKSIMTINGAVATIEGKQSKTLYIFYVVPKDASRVELSLK